MKAAIYNPYLDTLGGGERYTLAFASTLVKLGYSVDIQWSDKSIFEKFKDRFGISLDGFTFVEDIKRGDGYDICFWVSDGSIPTLRARQNILHFQIPFTKVDGRSLLNKMKLFRIDKIVCNSEFTKGFIDQEYGVNSSVLYPPVDTKNFKPKRKKNTIVYVGRFSNLTQVKGHDILIKAFKELLEKTSEEWELQLIGGADVGSDEYLSQLKNQSEDLPVKILEGIPFSKLTDLVGEAKIFWSAAGFGVDELINPQKVEHFGITVVEAMAASCVPIIINKGGYSEIVRHERDGYLWMTIEGLLDYTLEVSKNYKLWKSLSLEAKLRSQKFSYENFEKEIRQILEK